MNKKHALKARRTVAPVVTALVAAALAASSLSAAPEKSFATSQDIGTATTATSGPDTPIDPSTSPTSTGNDDPDAAAGDDNALMSPDDVPATTHTPCAEYARDEAVDQTTDDKWLCVGDVLTTTDSDTGERTAEVLDSSGEVERPATTSDIEQSTATPDDTTSSSTPSDAMPSSAGDLHLSAVVDDYHAVKTLGIGWSTGSASGWVNFRYSIGLYNHSGLVRMSYSSAKPVIMDWRLRIRHDISFGSDDTLFTYPEVMGSNAYVTQYSETESQYGDGYNKLPYQTRWKVFWDAYRISIRYAGTNVYSDNTAQSDRATCYKTVSCKFLG